MPTTHISILAAISAHTSDGEKPQRAPRELKLRSVQLVRYGGAPAWKHGRVLAHGAVARTRNISKHNVKTDLRPARARSVAAERRARRWESLARVTRHHEA